MWLTFLSSSCVSSLLCVLQPVVTPFDDAKPLLQGNQLLVPSPAVFAKGGLVGDAVDGPRPLPPSRTKPRKNLVLVLVVSDPVSLRTIGMASYTTWVREMEPFAPVKFFIGMCSEETKGFPGDIVCLDTPDVYPPQRKAFLLWKHVYDHFSNDYRWFLKVDHDTYVNTPRLLALLSSLETRHVSNTPQYLGLPATGRAAERQALGLNGFPYCSGLGYLINDATLKFVRLPYISTILYRYMHTQIYTYVCMH